MTPGRPAAVPAASRATPAILALYVKVGACLLAIGADVRRIVVAGELRDGRVLVDQLLGADQLVTVATVLEVVALVVAAVLVLRWALAVRAAARALAGVSPWSADARVRRVMRAWFVALGFAVAAVVASRLLHGVAEDVEARQTIDVLRALATALSGVAAGLTIAVVSVVTARQQERAAEIGLPGTEFADADTGRVSEGGLRVVSEEQARTGSDRR